MAASIYAEVKVEYILDHEFRNSAEVLLSLPSDGTLKCHPAKDLCLDLEDLLGYNKEMS